MTLTGILASAIITFVPLGGQLGGPEDVCGGDYGGAYQDWNIWVCEDGEYTEGYKQHEIGHLIDDKYLTEGKRNKYKAIYKKHHKVGVLAFQREYGYSDWQESFAEDYASWKTGEKVNAYTRTRIKLIISLLE